MKNIKDILLEKLILNKDSKSINKVYTFEDDNNRINLSINLPFKFYFPDIDKTAEIKVIKKIKNEFNEDVWAFYEYDKELDNEWRVVTLSAMGIINIFIKGPKDNYRIKTQPLVSYINHKSFGKRTNIELDDPDETVIKNALNEKLILNKDSKTINKIFWFTNNQGIKLPFDLTINEIHEVIRIVNIKHVKPLKEDLWKLYDENGNHVFTLYNLVLRTLFFNNPSRHVAILRTFDEELKKKVRNSDSIVVHYKDDLDKIIKESIQESQEEPKVYSNMIILNPQQDAILILKRTKDMPTFKYKWGFPGGSVEKDDKDNKFAAIRELKEETGIELTFNEEYKCHKFDSIKNNDGSISEYYITTLEEYRDITLSYEHSTFEWFNEYSQQKYRWMPDVFQIIQKIL